MIRFYPIMNTFSPYSMKSLPLLILYAALNKQSNVSLNRAENDNPITLLFFIMFNIWGSFKVSDKTTIAILNDFAAVYFIYLS